MARKAKTEAEVTERLTNFRRVVGEKMERSYGPLFVSALEKVTDGQWLALAKKSRYRARDASLTLALIGLQNLPEAAE